jgi:hypothetical protein
MNRPRSQRRKRARDRIWSGPLVSWTAANTRRQHERNNCHLANPFVSYYFAKYLLLGVVLAYVTLTSAGPIQSELLRTFASFFLNLTFMFLFLAAYWWFWPHLAWPWRRATRAWTGPYPSSSIQWITPLILTPFVIVGVAILCLVSPPIALIFSISVTGVWLILTGIRRRVGCDERCRCGYPVATPRWSRGLCPDCGRNLDRPRAVILGHDTRSPLRLTAGTAAVLLALFILWWRFAP